MRCCGGTRRAAASAGPYFAVGRSLVARHRSVSCGEGALPGKALSRVQRAAGGSAATTPS